MNVKIKAGFKLLTSCFFLLVSISNTVHAANPDGRIIFINGSRVTIELMRGRTANVGDEMEISLDLGGDVLNAGKVKIERIQGNRIIARITQRKMAIQNGMSANLVVQQVSPGTGTRQNPAGNEAFRFKPEKKTYTKPQLEEFDMFKKEAISKKKDESMISPSTNKIAIEITTTKQYQMVWKDVGSGARKDFATFRPMGNNGYYPLGDVAITEPWQQGRYAAPSFDSILVKNGTVELAKPLSYTMIWNSKGSHSDIPFSSWEPVAPPGYRCLGDVGIAALGDTPSTDAIRCIPEQCVEQIALGERIWRDKGSGAKLDFSAWRVSGLTTYIGYASHKKPQRSAYTISKQCLEE